MESSDSLSATFKKHAESFTHMIEEEGIVIRPYANPHLVHFSRMSKDEQEDVVARVSMYVLACVHMKQKRLPITNNRLFVETYLNAAGLNARTEDLDLIKNEHFIEIYNRNGMHLFRSLNILEISSYTFEDLCCRQWQHLYERPAEDQEKILAAATHFFQLTNPVRQETSLPFHVIEKDTLERLIYDAETKWLIPVFRDDSFEAALTILLNRNKEALPQFFKP